MGTELTPASLQDATDPAIYGGKAVSLGAALRAGLPVPPGLAVPAPLVEEIARRPDAVHAVLACPELPGGRLAVRSSAIGEDSADASFAGQHTTRLNVWDTGIAAAIASVHGSAWSGAALAYRARHGITTPPAIGVVLQALVEPVAAGVLFTRNPITGANERVIEAAWGLGEAVVSGLVTPDSYRLDVRGRLVERVVGCKDVRIWFDGEAGTTEVAVHPELHEEPCLGDEHLGRLHDLADRCCAVWGADLDLEWAVDGAGRVYLLQSRPITTFTGRA
jgi:pyruvate,water dikinase